MIGVIADSAEEDIVREFFELFKTPWEFYRSDRQYEVLLCAGRGQGDENAKVVLYYSGRRMHFDDENKIRTGSPQTHSRMVQYRGSRIPIYGDSVALPEDGISLLTDEGSQQPLAYLRQSGKGVLARVGYDLFGEVRKLLTVGQPRTNASVPTLELHIAFLRDLICGSGVSVTEIPPVPDGYQFIASLTHDVDHPSIRRHKWDRTMFGFLNRALFGSLRNLIGGRITFRDLIANWMAAFKLPFVHLGLARDFWGEFDDQYLELEKGLSSTFFVIPFEGRSGRTSEGSAPAYRATRYCAQDIAKSLQHLLAAGCEIGLHGIDAWVDDASGREELEEIRRLAGVSDIGVRMHWLYYDHESPQILEHTGALYDSTIGYNETVGYRAGTTQVYKPLEAGRLLELPLHVMDTALFYPAYLGLSSRQASTILSQMADNAVRFGGCLTINWHDRSLAPERLWGRCYRDLLQDLKSRDVWFSTAGQATSWFRKRRSVTFEADPGEPEVVRARVASDDSGNLPGLRLRVHKARESFDTSRNLSNQYVDVVLNEGVASPVACTANC